MAEGLAEQIRRLRMEQNLSMRELAARSGMSQSTLSRWEQGKFQPRIPELEAALNALGVTPTRRQQMLALLDAPRARKIHSTPQEQEAMGTLPCGGDLLRAMRLRNGMTLEQVAAGIGVQSSTLLRWERGEMRPHTERLHTLCHFLRAGVEEMATLTNGHFMPGMEAETPVSLDGIRAQLEELRRADAALRDLGLLVLEARLWRLATEQTEIQHLLLRVYAAHSLLLSDQKRYAEAGRYVARSLRMAARQQIPEDVWLPSVIVGARIATYGAKRRFPERGILRLRAWLPRVASVAFRAWMFSDIAEYLALDSSFEEALTLGERAVALVREMANGQVETLFRRRDLASLLVRAGRPQEALNTLSACSFEELGPEFVVRDLLLRSEAFLACRDTASANLCLTEAENSIALHHLGHLRPQVAALRALC